MVQGWHRCEHTVIETYGGRGKRIPLCFCRRVGIFFFFFANGVCLNSSDTGDLSEVFDMRLEGDYVAVVTGKLTGGG